MSTLNLKKQKKEVFTVRLPPELRRKVRDLAKSQSTEDAQISEAEVCRAILENFFEPSSPNCVPNGQ